MSALYAELVKGKRVYANSLHGEYFRSTTGIADNFPVSKDMPSWIFIKATTARDILMPAEEDVDGKLYFIHNEGAGVITVKTSSDGALSPAVTIGSGAAAVLFAVSGVWKKVADR